MKRNYDEYYYNMTNGNQFYCSVLFFNFTLKSMFDCLVNVDSYMYA